LACLEKRQETQINFQVDGKGFREATGGAPLAGTTFQGTMGNAGIACKLLLWTQQTTGCL
jgi:hypothetical protein